MEHWLGLVRFPGYEVSSFGRVRSCRRRGRGTSILRGTPRLLKPAMGSHGYLCVQLPCDGAYRVVCIHALVLEAFSGYRPEGLVCRHLDGNKLNNRPENLRWGTYRENTQDAVRLDVMHLRKGSKNINAKLTDEKVRTSFKLHRLGYTLKEIGDLFGVSGETIRKAVHRETWVHVDV